MLKVLFLELDPCVLNLTSYLSGSAPYVLAILLYQSLLMLLGNLISLSGLGFIIIANLTSLLIVGLLGAKHHTPIMAELAAINFALPLYKDHDWKSDCAFCDCPSIPNLLKNHNACVAWHIHSEFTSLKHLLSHFHHLHFNLIAREDNVVADSLANFGRSNVQLSLFFQDLDRPCWLDDICRSRNLFF